MKRFLIAALTAGVLASPAFAQVSKCQAPPEPPEVGAPTDDNIKPDKLKTLSDAMVPGLTAVNAYGKCLSKEIARVNAQWGPAQKKYKALLEAYDKKYQPQDKKK